MADFPAMPLFTDAYLGDTHHLTLEENGAYLKLLMIAWRTPDCSLPDDDKRLATMLGVTIKRWREKLKPAIEPFWSVEDGLWKQKKQQKVRKKVEKSVEQKRNAYSQTERAKRLKNNDTHGSNDTSDDPSAEESTKTKTKTKEDSESYTDSENPLRAGEGDRGVGKGVRAPPAEQAQPPPARSISNSASSGRPRSRPKTFVPETPTDDMRRLAAAVDPSVDVDREFPLFRAHYAAEGKSSADWSARWEKWLRNPIGKAIVEARPTAGEFRAASPESFARQAVTAYELALKRDGQDRPKPEQEIQLKHQGVLIASGGGGPFGLEGKIQWTAAETIKRVQNLKRAA